MKKLLGFLAMAGLIFASRPVLRQVFLEETYIKLPSKFYFTPLAKGKDAVAFAYVSKVEPTEEELKAERERLRKILDEGIKKQYGSYENYEKEMEKLGEKTQEEFNKKAPPLLRDLMPPSLFSKSVPFLMKAILLFARNLPFVSSPTGNLGETGVVILRNDLKPVVIKLGINEPVECMDFSKDGRYLAVLTDLSYEGKKRFHVVGKISVIDLEKNSVVFQTILANVQDQLAFTPDGKYLTFLAYRLDHREKNLYFMETGTWKIKPEPFTFPGTISHGNILGRTRHDPIYKFSPNGKYLIYRDPKLRVLSYPEFKEVFVGPGFAGEFFISPDSRYVLDPYERLWEIPSGKLIWKGRYRTGLEILSAQFFGDKLYIGNLLETRIVDIKKGKVIVTGDYFSKLPFLRLSQDGRYLASIARPFHGSSLIRYGRRMKVEKLEVHIADAQDLRLVQILNNFHPAALDLVFFGGKLLVSDYEGIWVFREK